MFVVVGASGNTGVVAETLLRQKKKVRVVLHDAAKGKAWGEAGADVAIANVDDGAGLERAFSGAEGLFEEAVDGGLEVDDGSKRRRA
jgi:NAD(P)H dehydrogenase (quinone)